MIKEHKERERERGNETRKDLCIIQWKREHFIYIHEQQQHQQADEDIGKIFNVDNFFSNVLIVVQFLSKHNFSRNFHSEN